MSTNKSTPATTLPTGELLFSMNADQVAEAIKASGCAVTAVNDNGVVRLHSASQGIGFQVMWGNALREGEYVDLTLSCPLRVQGGTLPEGLLGEWHRTKRFVRASQHGDFVVLEMDILAAGGIAPQHLAMMVQLWSQMMGQFFQHVRTYAAQAGAQQPAQSTQQEATAEA
ncbi:YbjN domain-containing protein [Comamonas sp. 17RB]|uniref:YbjN domain-containing protein n=1 Tax=Comamonas sp. 17RB TaxID=3047025 RepID=UPI0024B6C8C1|nr:YbjN domain-containing protein [Comamonas sp. 17RB]MDI9855570.1 YbjN domain-containing protein [Comamonas sp. 17RB]